MNYEPYPNKKAVPSRMTRKQARRKVFITNKKSKRLYRKTRQQERALLAEAN